jgi:hypothetical protein
MPRVDLYLSDGFSHDRVVVRVNGRQVLAQEGITTAALTGLAATFQLEVHDTSAVFEVELPTRHLLGRFEIDTAATPHVAVSVDAAGIQHYASSHPLGGM